ncbi:N-formylglutamate amidohydrolase [Altererythrobacter sp. CC-YST694]|uniref:N-formylglutamate amidohydrolase n=1 Tax=Altererythrobacter sp. CC-YST694 TaxID=2755038 RepID=UPI001D0091EA|nr:N-formylglutamate amidohydrolase [Altererythrobacter sp. CC-YST694]MCB5424638.1 N-formylglutamate amidohydrolase [Altererythrobacter sp. CC-YST694]
MIEHEAYRILGTPRFGGILVVSDHASNAVPGDIELGIDPALLNQHIAIDIGVAVVGELMAQNPGIAAFQGNVSRLVCDFNRDEDSLASVPEVSDGVEIPGNRGEVHEARMARFYRPYHSALARLLEETPPSLILSLHSFTPQLASDPDCRRPWECGVLYNQDDRAARVAIPVLAAEGLNVGDNQPYSGKVLNTTMNVHAEAEGRPYFGVEVRQDRLSTPEQQAEWAERLARICNRVAIAIGE